MDRKATIESIVLGILIIVIGGYIAINGGVISLHLPSVGTNIAQNQSQQQGQQINPDEQSSKPPISISNETEYWNFYDSKGHPYQWSMPLSTYDYNVQRAKPISY